MESNIQIFIKQDIFNILEFGDRQFGIFRTLTESTLVWTSLRGMIRSSRVVKDQKEILIFLT